MSDKMREALKLADAALFGANMDMNVVKRKIREAIDEHIFLNVVLYGTSHPEMYERPAQGDSVPMPQNADQAALMALIGEAWLRNNAPERLKPPAPAVPDDAVIETCDHGHRYAKLPDHPRRDGKPRCPHCLAIGLDAARARSEAPSRVAAAPKVKS